MASYLCFFGFEDVLRLKAHAEDRQGIAKLKGRFGGRRRQVLPRTNKRSQLVFSSKRPIVRCEQQDSVIRIAQLTYDRPSHDQGLLIVMERRFDLGQVKPGVEVAGVESQDFLEAFASQISLALKHIGVAQGCSSTHQVRIKR